MNTHRKRVKKNRCAQRPKECVSWIVCEKWGKEKKNLSLYRDELKKKNGVAMNEFSCLVL
jgi:hypothetical protein